MSHTTARHTTAKVHTAAKVSVAALVTGLAVVLSPSAHAGLRFGPGAVIGLVAAPLHMMTHGVPAIHRRAAHGQSATPSPPPAAPPTGRAAPKPAVEPVAEPVAEPSPAPPRAIEARADPAPVAEPSPPPPPVALLPPWPTASASVYEDLLGYVLWPGDYADRLWTHGYGDVMNAVLAPIAARESHDQAARMLQSGMCSAKAGELADQLAARTAEMIEPSPDQKAALDELASALREAIDRGRTAVCAGSGDPLKQTVDGLWTMWDATLLMRAPLGKFYDALTPTQQAKLAGGAAAGAALARACADQRPADWPDARLDQALAADPERRRTLEALRQRSSELSKFLALSCPREIKPTPVDRLDAARERMNALLYVVMSMSPALTELYGSAAVAPGAVAPGKPVADR
jgi:hypothetical protein